MVGFIKRITKRRIFFGLVERRDGTTLTKLIEKYVAKGSYSLIV